MGKEGTGNKGRVCLCVTRERKVARGNERIVFSPSAGFACKPYYVLNLRAFEQKGPSYLTHSSSCLVPPNILAFLNVLQGQL